RFFPLTTRLYAYSCRRELGARNCKYRARLISGRFSASHRRRRARLTAIHRRGFLFSPPCYGEGMNDFKPMDMVRFGWATFNKRPWFFIGVQFLLLLISFGASQIPLLGFIVSIFVSMGTIAFMLKAHENVENLTFHDLWAPHP